MRVEGERGKIFIHLERWLKIVSSMDLGSRDERYERFCSGRLCSRRDLSEVKMELDAEMQNYWSIESVPDPLP